jgi:hypothetical protein
MALPLCYVRTAMNVTMLHRSLLFELRNVCPCEMSLQSALLEPLQHVCTLQYLRLLGEVCAVVSRKW